MYLYLNSNKLFFFFILIFSTLISISSNNWFGCWMGLEINLLSFIPLISNSSNLFSSEASLKYFLVQSIASMNFLFYIIMKMMILKNFEMNYYFSILINLPLFMKMGSFPFHFWFPNIMEGLTWLNSFLLMTWQKITPMILISYFPNSIFFLIIATFNSIIGAVGGLNQTSLRKLMAFSSINNLSWMILSMLISENLWIFYMMLYSFLISIMCFYFQLFNLSFINQIFTFNLNYLIKIYFSINLLSLGGLPPFIGFLPKWILINFLMKYNLFFITIIFIMMSLIMLFFYLRITFSSLLFNYLKLKWSKSFIKNNYIFFLNILSFSSISGMIISTFIFF